MRRREVSASKKILGDERLTLGGFDDNGSSDKDSSAENSNTYACLPENVSLSKRATIQLYDSVNSSNNIVSPNVDNMLDSIVDTRDTLNTSMCKHLNEWKIQREFVLKYKQEPVLDKKCGLQWPYRKDTCVGDYYQNFGLPHFGNEQPGETYYYSPLGIYVFGIVNYTGEKINAYEYHEGGGVKGGNTVCCLAWKNLLDLGIIKEWEESGKKQGGD